jgi:hypothetical protein
MIGPENCWGCGVNAGPSDDVRPMAFVEKPEKLRFHLCAKCRVKSPFNDGALVEQRQ